jgi:phosphate:Na+ symporter
VAGVGVTVVFQSSSATISLLVGMASAGLLTLGQALGVILGADIGTTVTVQLLAFRLFDYAIVVAVLGFVLMNAGRRAGGRGRKPWLGDLGQAVFGFGLVFWSLRVVLGAAEPLRYMPQVSATVAAIGGVPWLALLFAAVFTALVRSSAATIGIIVGLSFVGLVNLSTAVPFILGANVGTCFSAILASWRGSTEARRIAAGHVLFKLAIVVVALPFLGLLTRFFALTAGTVPRQIANAHTLINVIALLLFLPVLPLFERAVRRLVPERAGFGPRYLDPVALEAPEVAVAQASREVLRMGDLVLGMYHEGIRVFLESDKEGRRRLVAEDDRVDKLEESITGYLARMSQEELSPEISRRNLALFYVTDELERIADVVSKNLMGHAYKKIEEGLAFSEAGLAEIQEFHASVEASLTQALACLATWDPKLARQLVERRAWGVERRRELHDRHLGRLSQGLKETMDTSTVHLDLIADIERINFHCSQVGQAVLTANG